MIATNTIREFEQQLREALADWPLYQEQDHVKARFLPAPSYPRTDTPVWVGYCQDPLPETGLKPFYPQTFFESSMRPHVLNLNVDPVEETCYLLEIAINRKQRGKGHGEELYQVVEQFAYNIGCREVRQTPSGGYGDRSRRDYLIDRGWEPFGDIEVRKVLK
jgi:GNAT superfamily N-acetyltransferase